MRRMITAAVIWAVSLILFYTVYQAPILGPVMMFIVTIFTYNLADAIIKVVYRGSER